MNARDAALAEWNAICEMIGGIDPNETDSLAQEIKKAGRIFIGGAGRSLLSMKGFAMRLMQTGHETYLVGEVCTPSIQPGDLLIVGSGSGNTQVTLDVVHKAKQHGARTAVLTMHPEARIPRACDCVVAIPPIPEVNNPEDRAEVFMKGNLQGNFSEAALTLILDGVVACRMEMDGLTGGLIRKNHANLE
ncbi:SIS domain-containing protein [Anaerolentibacter hominis]|uniref:SIS domain-containing protein n=1 Tax=Anaerolentibacter hominis TaxID=3079009 RepID=UPI0031B80A09